MPALATVFITSHESDRAMSLGFVGDDCVAQRQMTPRSSHQHLNQAVALKAFDRVADVWQLSTEERCQILKTECGTYGDWTSGSGKPTLSDSQIITISKVINIYDGLHRLFGDKSYADRWVRCENAAFEKQQPLNLLLTQDAAGLDRVFKLVMDALII